MLFPVLHRDDHISRYVQAGLFFDLFQHILFYRHVHVHPSPGQGPSSVLLLHQQNPVLLEDCGAAVDFRRLISDFVAEEVLHFVQGNVRLVGNHLRRYFPNPFIALPVESVLSIEKPRLCQAL